MFGSDPVKITNTEIIRMYRLTGLISANAEKNTNFTDGTT